MKWRVNLLAQGRSGWLIVESGSCEHPGSLTVGPVLCLLCSLLSHRALIPSQYRGCPSESFAVCWSSAAGRYHRSCGHISQELF